MSNFCVRYPSMDQRNCKYILCFVADIKDGLTVHLVVKSDNKVKMVVHEYIIYNNLALVHLEY